MKEMNLQLFTHLALNLAKCIAGPSPFFNNFPATNSTDRVLNNQYANFYTEIAGLFDLI